MLSSAGFYYRTTRDISHAPTFVLAGNAAGATGIFNYNYATQGVTYQDDDILFGLFQTNNETPPNTPAGWTWLTSYGDGTPGAVNSVALHMAWARASGTMNGGQPGFGDAGDHMYGRIYVIRGCRKRGAPVVVLNGTVGSTSTPMSFPVADTPFEKCLVAHVGAHGRDAASQWQNSTTSSSLESVTYPHTQSGTSIGNGGGISFAYGVKLTPGSLGSPTVDLINLTLPVVVARATIAFIPRGAD